MGNCVVGVNDDAECAHRVGRREGLFDLLAGGQRIRRQEARLEIETTSSFLSVWIYPYRVFAFSQIFASCRTGPT